MFEDNDEELEFWSRVPDRPLDRFAMRRQQAKRARHDRVAARRPASPAGSRSHDTGAVPVVGTAGHDAAGTTAATVTRAPHVDPLLRRTGTLAVVIALLVPVAFALRGGGDDRTVAPAVTDATTAAPAPDTAMAATPAPAPGASVAEQVVTTIDIDALPEAVPVVTEAPPATQAEVKSAAVTTAPVQVAAAAGTAQAKVESAPVARTSCAKKYTVQAGDAWITIAKRAGVSTKQLLAANGATTSTAIYPGRDICLPAGAATPTPTPTTAAPATTVKPATKPATAPKAPTTTAAPVPTRAYSKAEVAQIIRDVWPDDLEDEAVRIATRESNLVPTAKNFCCYGLFQVYFNVHKKWLAQMGVTSANQLLDPRTNALAGLVLWQRSGSWAPWGG